MHAIKTICVCGAGTMGSGIAQVAATYGFATIQFDLSETVLQKSKESIIKGLNFLQTKGKITASEHAHILSRIVFTSDINDCKADLIIEAIVEKKEVKINLFNQLAVINADGCILATNTSSLSISEIAAEVSLPQRVVGMHFFNPAPAMKLVEVVRGQATDDRVVAAVADLARVLGKTPVVCKDVPGFIVNRVARSYYLEAMHLVAHDLATVETIDTLLESCGFKMGPFHLMDLIGMDINYNVSTIVWEALGKPVRLTPSAIQKAKVMAGELGRKSGKGFYSYSTPPKS